MWENIKDIQLDYSNLTVLVIGFLIGYITGVITSKLLKLVITLTILMIAGVFIYYKYIG